MPRRCTICIHNEWDAINKALIVSSGRTRPKDMNSELELHTSQPISARPGTPGQLTRVLVLAKSQVSRNLSRHLPYYLTPEEARQLIDAANNERNQLFLRLFWETGDKVSEAISLRLADVGRDGIRVLGKGYIERVVFIQDRLVTTALFYAQELGMKREDYLFRSRRGGHITKQRADQIIKVVASRKGLERSVHDHLFRHGYAINFLNCGGRLDALQEQLGHRDINTTRIYLRLIDQDVKREVAKIQF